MADVTGNAGYSGRRVIMPAVGPLLFRVFAVFLLCMVALLVVVAGWSRSTARHEARQNAAELTRLIESQVARMFEAVDILLILPPRPTGPIRRRRQRCGPG
jgi:Mn2+/Fe2+ NRAMP family transporter